MTVKLIASWYNRNQTALLGLCANFISSEIILTTIYLYWIMIILLIFSNILCGSIISSDVIIDLSKAELDEESGNFCVIQKVRSSITKHEIKLKVLID